MPYRQFEPWMKKGATVQMPNNTGTLHSIVTAELGETTGYSGINPVVLSCTVKLTGVKQAFPFNPWDMSQLQPKKLPYPEHIG